MTEAAPSIHSGDPRVLGRTLRTWRAIRRIKQLHAAELLRVSQATISRWENGQAAPDPDEAERLRRLMAARLDSDADRVLGRLVRQSSAPVHLVCDLTHRLLAASPAREAQFKVPASTLLGVSLWRCASEDIVRAEGQLAEIGWFGPAPPALAFRTGRRESADLVIHACEMRWVRFQLSDGSHARLVETVAPLATAGNPGHGAAPVSQSASSPSESQRR